MSCDNVGFRGVDHYGNPTLTEQLESNLKHFLDWSFLKIGAWQEVSLNTQGMYGGNFYTMHNSYDEAQSSYTTYQSIRKDWVYETGVNYQSPSLNISTITYNAGSDKNQVNLSSNYNAYFVSGDTVTVTGNALQNTYTVFSGGTSTILLDDNAGGAPVTGGTIYGIYNPSAPTIYVSGNVNTDNYIDYPNGRVVFDYSLESSSSVTATYAYRNIQTYIGGEVPWLYEIQKDTLNPNDLQWSQNIDSGNYSPASAKRAQLPAIIIEATDSKNIQPFQMGDFKNRVTQDVIFTVVTQNKYEKNNIVDILRKMYGQTFWLYNQYEVYRNDAFPLDYKGAKNTGAVMYDDLVSSSTYRWRRAHVTDIKISPVEIKTPELFMAKVRCSLEIID